MIKAVVPRVARPKHQPPGLVAFLVPLLAFGALEAFARSQVDPVASAETSYLAFWIACALAAMTAADVRSSRIVGGLTLLAVTTTWIVDYGPHRTAVISLLFMVGWVLVLRRWWGTSGRSLPIRVPIAAFLGFQLLLRPELSLSPTTDHLVELILVPILGGWAIARLGRLYGVYRAFAAAIVTALFLPGWGLAAVSGLLAISLVGVLRRYRWWALLALPLLVLDLPGMGWLLVIFVMPFNALFKKRGWIPALLLGLSTVGLAWGDEARWAEVFSTLSLGLALLPSVLLARPEDRWRAMNGAVFASWSMILAPDAGWMVVGLALVALSLPRRGWVAEWQGAWLLLWGLVTTALASVPWCRDAPLAWILELLGWEAWTAAVFSLGVLGVIWRLGKLAPGSVWRKQQAAGSVLVVLTLAGLSLIPSTITLPVSYQGVRLDHHRPRWSTAFEPATVGSLVVDSNLIHGVELAPGTPVVRVELVAEGGEIVDTWLLSVGEHTSEWAAAREDIAALPGFVAPSPWLVQVAPGRGFFAQRYRASWRFERPREIHRVNLWRHAELPKEVIVMVYRMELRH